jgi:predicted RNA-binding protein
MCLAEVYWIKGGRSELVMKDVETARSEKADVWDLTGVFGDHKRITARIKRVHCLENRIIFEEAPKGDHRS